MTESLSFARFQELADAYGGVIARWPEEVRDDAMALARDARGAAILEQAASLDAALDSWTVAPPSPSLQPAFATAARPAIATRIRLWWSAIGFAAALAGAVAGTSAVAMAVPFEPSAIGSTSFGDVSGQDG
ncbi:hypothetical protein [Sphingomonas sp.]|uniref:hypothetical protein n=1 Tax=Sphingomonas sp. TaxID=28214 RepID=UPI003B3B1D43